MDDISITAVLPRYPAVAFGGQAVVVTIIQYADTGEFGLEPGYITTMDSW